MTHRTPLLHRHRRASLALAIASLMTLPSAAAHGQLVRSFFGGLRREINWDGVPATFSAPNPLPGNFFNANSPRGAVLSTPGTGFQLSGAVTDVGAGQPAAANFGNINATIRVSSARSAHNGCSLRSAATSLT